jgi:hypothetical protein
VAAEAAAVEGAARAAAAQVAEASVAEAAATGIGRGGLGGSASGGGEASSEEELSRVRAESEVRSLLLVAWHGMTALLPPSHLLTEGGFFSSLTASIKESCAHRGAWGAWHGTASRARSPPSLLVTEGGSSSPSPQDSPPQDTPPLS